MLELLHPKPQQAASRCYLGAKSLSLNRASLPVAGPKPSLSLKPTFTFCASFTGEETNGPEDGLIE
jgi:hypothetical protein